MKTTTPSMIKFSLLSLVFLMKQQHRGGGFVVAQNCPLCPNGSAPPDPDKKLNFFSSRIWSDSDTCGELAVDPKFINEANDGLCMTNQVTFGMLECGCEQNIQISDDVCTICPGGILNVGGTYNTDAPLNQKTIDKFGDNSVTTCGDLADNTAYQEQSFFDCAQSQLTVGVNQCGCLSDQVDGIGCTLCPDGSMGYDPDIVVDAITNRTCGDIASLAALSPSDQCDFFHLTAAGRCGCPSLGANDGCSLCADKSEPNNLEGFVGDLFDWFGDNDDSSTNGNGPTRCGELMEELPFVPSNSDFCTQAQWAAAIACDCPPPVATEDSCTLCLDNETGNNLIDGFFDFISDIGGGGEETMDSLLNCDEATDILQVLPKDSDLCRAVQVSGALPCGCPPPANGCTICYDGLVPDKLDGIFDFLGGGDGRNCNDIFDFAPLIPEDSPMCTYIQALAFIDCGCPVLPELSRMAPNPPDETDPACVICDDVSMQADPSTIVEGSLLTCGDVYNASTFFRSSNDCKRDDFVTSCCITDDIKDTTAPPTTASPTTSATGGSSTLGPTPEVTEQPTEEDTSSSTPSPTTSATDASTTPGPTPDTSSSHQSATPNKKVTALNLGMSIALVAFASMFI